MIKAQIIKDSIAQGNPRLTTFLLTYPRFIHPEFMTHRVFSRNASSSRAIPFKTQIKMILKEIAMPVSWGLNQKGMQSKEEAGISRTILGQFTWFLACVLACLSAGALHLLGFHKQIVNRILEPFMHISVICTATDFQNFFALRCHSAAQPEIHELAVKMWKEYDRSIPQNLKDGEWHLPFVNSKEGTKANIEKSVACCARVSYLNHDKTTPTPEDNARLHDMLLGHNPKHASPAEHQAKCMDFGNIPSNLRGWTQYRKTLSNENITKFERH